MGLQLIFAVETNKKCKSDWIYIKETIDKFYEYSQSQVKLSVVYMDGKGKYQNKSVKREINKLIKQYAATSKTNESKVIYCFDCDDYDRNQEDATFIKNAGQYCETEGYEFVWFCKDVERVYLGEKVKDSQKQKEAVIFKTKKMINNVNIKNLRMDNYRSNTSNIINILDKYLNRIKIE